MIAPNQPATLRVDLTILPGARARVVFREIPETPLSFVLTEMPSIPSDGTEVEDNCGTVWTAIEVDLSRPSVALSSAGCFVAAARQMVVSRPAAAAQQLRQGLAFGLVALLALAREHAARPR